MAAVAVVVVVAVYVVIVADGEKVFLESVLPPSH